MDVIDRDTLLRLAGRAEWPSVSIFLPTDHTGIHTDADRIRLRNLVRDAHEHLVADGLRSAEADALLEGALAAASDEPLWAGGPSGLALFASSSGVETFWLNTVLPEQVIVGDRFYLRPLYVALPHSAKVWALAIDSNHTRLFHLDRSSVDEVALPAGTPLSVADDTQYDVREESLQYHTVPGATPQGVSPGSNAAMFHGHGGSKDIVKMERQRFMQELSRGVVATIGAQSADPLVLLGVEYLMADFRVVSDYAHIAPEQVAGATDQLSPADVQRAVIAALEPRMQDATRAAVDEYKAVAGTAHASSNASEIVAAAAAGRVKTLLMDDSSGPFGWFDRSTFDVTHLCPVTPRYLRDSMQAPNDADIFECGWDLIDLAAAETLRHGGDVRAFTGEQSPIAGAAAIYRY